MRPLYEVPGVRQPSASDGDRVHRRIFANEEFTLHVWYDRSGGRISEFHVFYGTTRERRVSWSRRRARVRDGEVTERGFWGADGLRLPVAFDAERFRAAAASIDPEVRAAVLAALDAGSRLRRASKTHRP